MFLPPSVLSTVVKLDISSFRHSSWRYNKSFGTSYNYLEALESHMLILDESITPYLRYLKFSINKIKKLSQGLLFRLSEIFDTAAKHLNSRQSSSRVAIHLTSHIRIFEKLLARTSWSEHFFQHLTFLDVQFSLSYGSTPQIHKAIIPNLKEVSVQSENSESFSSMMSRKTTSVCDEGYPFVVNVEKELNTTIVREFLSLLFEYNIYEPGFFKCSLIEYLDIPLWHNLISLLLTCGFPSGHGLNFPNLKFVAIGGIKEYSKFNLNGKAIERVYLRGCHPHSNIINDVYEPLSKLQSLKEVFISSTIMNLSPDCFKFSPHLTTLAQHLERLTLTIGNVSELKPNLLTISPCLPKDIELRVIFAPSECDQSNTNVEFGTSLHLSRPDKLFTKVENFPLTPYKVFRDTGFFESDFLTQSNTSVCALTVNIKALHGIQQNLNTSIW